MDAVSDETSSSDGKFNSKFIVNHLIYADDLVCIAPNANDLQALIDVVSLWCSKFRLEANLLKTEILHVRKSLVPCSKFQFKFGKRDIHNCQQYKYLGLYIDQFLNFEKMSNLLAEPSKRALNGPRVNLAYHRADFARASFVNDARICGTNFWRDLTRARHLLMSREKVGNMTRI